ncbi:MAG TPA: ribosomal protein S18-alanine N-acetyltransferase [Candidatus Acidoferrum sp.]|nr:ribosomal protein S18-alanine N-acetyltransferase [Candidatus Acidoferrum sp.]
MTTSASSLVIVRPLVVADLSKILLLAKSCPEAAQWTPSAFELGIGDVHGWVISDREIVFGFLAVRAIPAAKEMELLNLAVGPNWRRKGYASALLNAALAECHQRDYESIFLEVRESNERALSFYKKHGFSSSGRRPRYYSNPEEAAVTMFRRLKDQ